MSKADRAFQRRKDVKLFNEVHKSKQRKENEDKRLKALNDKMKAHFKTVAEKVVPASRLRLAQRIPPMWYLKFWRAIVLNLPSEKFSYYIAERKGWMWPDIRKAFNIGTCVMLAVLISVLLVNPFIALRRFVGGRGLTIKKTAFRDTADNAKVRLTIFYKGNLVDESVWNPLNLAKE
jgi:hypothetical protein